jgi:hypothetical protein
MLFSERLELTKAVAEWCKKNKLPRSPLNVITALDWMARLKDDKKIYIYSFDGHWPVGAYMYIRAESIAQADELFKQELPKKLWPENIKDGKVDHSSVKLHEVKADSYLISDGNY